MKVFDRWGALVAAIGCILIAVMLHVAPVVSSQADISVEEAVMYRHWFEGGLVVYALLLLANHFVANSPRRAP